MQSNACWEKLGISAHIRGRRVSRQREESTFYSFMPVSGLGAPAVPCPFLCPHSLVPPARDSTAPPSLTQFLFSWSLAGNEVEGRASATGSDHTENSDESQGDTGATKYEGTSIVRSSLIMTAVNGSGLSCDLSQPEKSSPTTPFVHQPPPHLAQECQETSPTIFPGSRKWWKAHHHSVSLPWSMLTFLWASFICKVME